MLLRLLLGLEVQRYKFIPYQNPYNHTRVKIANPTWHSQADTLLTKVLCAS